jgi:PAS domain S-box-containing protein
MRDVEPKPKLAALEEAFVRDLRLIFEASSDVLLVLLPDSPNFTMVAATNARLKATHCTREETIGRPLFELFPDNPEDPEATGTHNLRASLERVLATRAPDTMAVQRYDIRRADGTFETKYWSPKNLPVLSPSGEVLYILHRVEDVTELVLATEMGDELRDKTHAMEREIIKRSRELAEANVELREANAKLGALDAAKTAFFSNVSHEFRTPLTLMLGPLEDAMNGMTALSGEDLRLVHRNAIRLLRLVNSLLDYSRLEAGRFQLNFQPTDVSALTAGLAGSFQSLVESAGMSFVVDCPPVRRLVYVDRNQWEKVISNLLSNAFKFTLEGEISVHLRERPAHVELIVRDTGVGIPQEEIGKLFERFHRVEGTRGRSFEGTGIGLALVKELVDLHGGSVHVESTLGKGSTFTVSIPLGSDHLPRERVTSRVDDTSGVGTLTESFVLEASRWTAVGDKAVAPKPTETDAPSADIARVLVVDDNADMRNYIVNLLRPHWAVDTAPNGEVALAMVREHPPDLVISDVTMPNLDGFGLLHAIRAAPSTREIRVILLSARAGEEAVVEGLERGADDYLVKPFSGRELLTRVRSQLDSARAKTVALQALETRLKHLAESGIVSIAVSDARGRLLEANDAFVRMVGGSREELLSAPDAWELVTPSSRPVGAGMRAVEGEYQHRDGRRIPVLVAVEPLEGGESIAIAFDLTEHKQLEEQYRQAQKMEAVGRLAGGIAHDFNNVLSVILSYSDMLCSDVEDPVRADIEQIRRAAIRASELTRQLLAFSRQQVLEPRVLSINDSVSQMEKILRHLLGADIALSLVLEPKLWNVMADPSQIEQIVMNLAVNARDAMPQGGTLTIETSNVTLDERDAARHHEATPGTYVMLTVSDSGIGMDRATQSRIFEPFFTTKPKGKGTGLGLATVFGIVKQSRGHVSVQSELGQGTSFKLHFPQVSEDAPTSQHRTVEVTQLAGTETILLVEDDDQVRGAAMAILRRNGYEVLEAKNAGEGLLLCERVPNPIHLLITDVVLPMMSGTQLAHRLVGSRPNMKVLCMSGYNDDTMLTMDFIDSRLALLPKPITPESLLLKVRQVLATAVVPTC